MQSNQRNPLRLLVKKDLQLRILGLVGGAIFLALVLGAGLVYASFEVALRSLPADSLVRPLLQELLQNLKATLFWEGILMTALGMFLSLFVSRRVAGPLYRIERELERALNGVLSREPIRVREGDSLQHFVELLNRLIAKSKE